MRPPIRLYKEPKLRDPYLIAAWPGMGYVALGVAGYLSKKLEAERLGEIEPFDFFYQANVLFKDSVVEIPKLPENKFYYWKNEAAENDLIIFLGEAQPPAEKGYELADRVLDVAELFGVKRIYTSAATLTNINHTKEPKVFGVANHASLVKYLKNYDVVSMGEGHISGLNGLLLGVAKERGIKGVCLLGEIPVYAVQIQNPRSSAAILNILTRMLSVQIDMSELGELAQQTEAKLSKLIEQLRQSGPPVNQETIEGIKGETSEPEVPQSARRKIERLFKEAERDRSKAIELKAELDRWGLFSEYEDRFLDLFKRGDH